MQRSHGPPHSFRYIRSAQRPIGKVLSKPKSDDPGYRAGIELFNRGEYFDAHEVWESLWGDCPSAERRFYQALIQAAVAAYHFERGNDPGAARLSSSGKRYMEPFRPVYRGLDVDAFWRQLEAYISPARAKGEVPRPTISIATTSEGKS